MKRFFLQVFRKSQIPRQIEQIVFRNLYDTVFNTISFNNKNWKLGSLTDTRENVQKWTRVFSTGRWVILVARTRRKKREENSVSTFGRFRCGQVLSPRLYRLNLYQNYQLSFRAWTRGTHSKKSKYTWLIKFILRILNDSKY